MKQQELVQRYAELDSQVKALKEEMDGIRDQIQEDLPEEGVKTPIGSFSWATRKTWSYSGKVKAMEADLKDLKSDEQSNGAAKFTETRSLKFTPPKK
jgi:uncharacterized protein involved in exopolysaccharide biosynthesis